MWVALVGVVLYSGLSQMGFFEVEVGTACTPAEHSLMVAQKLGMKLLLSLAVGVAVYMLLYVTWRNVVLLAERGGVGERLLSPWLMVLLLLVPGFAAYWVFVAWGRLPRLVREVTGGACCLPRWLFVSFCCLTCVGELGWLRGLGAEYFLPLPEGVALVGVCSKLVANLLGLPVLMCLNGFNHRAAAGEWGAASASFQSGV